VVVSSSTFVKNEINEVRWCPRNDRTLHSKNLARYNISVHTVIALKLRDYSLQVLLIRRLTEFILCVQVDPKLKPSTSNIEASGHLCMHNAFTSSHPLDITRAYHTTVAFEVFVMDFTF
jgi:hypothetical protein